MKILYVLPTSPIYGDNKALFALLPTLEKRGIQPMFLVSKNSDTFHYLNNRGYKCIYFSRLINNFWPMKKDFRSFLWQIKEHVLNMIYIIQMKDILSQIREFAPDIIHTNSSNCSLGYYIAKKIHKPHIWHIREYGDLDACRRHFPNKKLFEKKLKKNFNTNIVITRDIKKYFHLGNNTIPIYDGPITNTHPTPLFMPKEKYFLFVGRLTSVKGVDIVIKAFTDFCKLNNEYKLLIAGSGDKTYTDSLRELIYKNKIEKSVKLLGYRTDIDRLMQRATALIVASRFEAFGFITAEAMSNGCPVIGKNTAGTKEQFDNVEEHLGYPCCRRFVSKEQLTTHMMSEVSTPVDNKTLQAIQKYVIYTYSASHSAECVFNLYKEICN